MVKVLLDASGGTATYYCSGTVVGTKTVLTAAHCIELTTLSKTLVEMNGAVHTVARIVRHPAWNKSASAYLNDIGLVILDNVAPVTPQIAAASAPVAGQAIKLVGFGRTDPNDGASGRNKHSSNMTVGNVSATHYVVDGYNGNAANGDSGGAALATIGGSKQLLSVISTSSTDWQRSFHIRVDAFRSWLDSESGNNVQWAGGAPPPQDSGPPPADTVQPPPGDGAAPGDSAPATKPNVAITVPSEGATTPLAVDIHVTVTHDKAIRQVQLYVDDTPVNSLSQAPYRFFAQVGPGPHVLRVTARDERDVIGEGSVNITASQMAPDFGVPPDLQMQPPTLDANAGSGDGGVGVGDGTGGVAKGGCAVGNGGTQGVAVLVLLLMLMLMLPLVRRRR
ncbi:MAG: trypsin-like serine protease [Myxococcales bacterium]|nr:trypsin-like serine protease [Myxococcales bacterium]